MELYKAIYSILTNATDVMAELPSTTSVQPIRAKKPVNYPVLVYRVENITPYDTKTGPSTVDRVSVKFIIAAKTVLECVDIHKELRLVIDRYNPTVVSDVHIDGVRFVDAYFSDWHDDNDVSELHADYDFRVKRDPQHGGPFNMVPEDFFVERLEIEDFEPTSGRSVSLSKTPAEILIVVRGASNVIDYTVDDNVITMPSSDPAFGEYESPEEVRVVYIRAYS